MADGFLLVDPSGLGEKQAVELDNAVVFWKGWRHPDGVRWILPVQYPKTLKEKWIRQGWPVDSIQIAW